MNRTVALYIGILLSFSMVNTSFSLDGNYLLENNKTIFSNLYIDSFDDYRNLKTSIESVSYFMTTKNTNNDNYKNLLNSFRDFSNTIGNSHIGLQINPTKNFSEYQSFKKQSECKKYFFDATDADKLIYEDKLSGKCFYLPVDDINSLVNVMNKITEYINGERGSLTDIGIKEGVNNELSKYKYFKNHRDVLYLVVEYLKEKFL